MHQWQRISESINSSSADKTVINNKSISRQFGHPFPRVKQSIASLQVDPSIVPGFDGYGYFYVSQIDL